MQVVDIDIKELTPYEKNPRKNDEAVQYVAESIKQFGFKVPIVIDKNNVIIAGHTRYKAAKKLKLKTAPCLIADDLTDEQIKAFRLADNKVAEFSEWDFDLLELELKELENFDLDFDLTDFGFDDIFEEEEYISAEEIEEDNIEDIEVPQEPKSKTGDIYQLGNHRLMCGDSTSVTDIEKILNGNEVDLVLTDPPYGINIVKNNGKVGGDGRLAKSKTYMPIKGDESTETAQEFYNACVSLGIKNYILFGGNYFTDFLEPKSCWVVWDKKNGDNNFADVELAWTSFNKGAKLYQFLWNGSCREGDKKTELVTRVHPTQKPVGLMADILKGFSKENDNILDAFGGSGSTLIACEKLNRRCFMMEMEPKYVDVIIARWEEYTGEKAVLLNN